MNDEIKEILNDLKDKCKYIEDYGYQYKRLSLEDTEILLDYITNLQQKVEWYESEGVGYNEKICKKYITEELADVMVMLKQFQYYYGITDKEIEDIMNYKIDRQLERIEKENIDN